MEKWYDVYKELSDLLLDFYASNPKNCGRILFKKYFNEKEIKYKKWLGRPLLKSKNASVDPVHIFSSFNASRQNEIDREKIIYTWFKVLSSKRKFQKIDFIGCPTPVAIKLLSRRDPKSQSEIWDTFRKIKKEAQKGLTVEIFHNLKRWYGIEVPSFTIFLFWIDAKNFLPLDKNSERLLLEAGIIRSLPRKSDDYIQLLPLKNTTLYIDIAKYGFQLATGSVSKLKRPEIKRFFEKLRSVYYSFNRKLHAGGKFNFKLVAVRLLRQSNKKHTKVLNIGRIYSFYKEYHFQKNGWIKLIRDLDINLYDINNLSINISAIVGKNGSGKSTLSEVLFLAINNLAALTYGNSTKLRYEPGLNFELYYTIGTFIRLRLINKKILITEYQMKGDMLFPRRELDNHTFNFSQFFYTIAVNYSHYGLNSLELGEWISELFHKNDGYQTPLTINPFRKEGNININTENELVKSRLFANIVQPIDADDPNHLRVLTEKKKAIKKVRFSKHSSKIEELKLGRQTTVQRNFNVFLRHFRLSVTRVRKDFVELTKLYLTSKLIKICKNYTPYAKFLKETKNNSLLINLPQLLDKIDSDPSHISYKIKQIINYYRYKTYKWYPLNKNIDIEKISESIEAIKSKEARIKQIKSVELLPPSFYDFDFLLTGGSSFRKLSSGEKQRIYTVSSIVYHLYNIDSVSEENDLITYPFVNITFDEIELYFHPEMQRKFVNYFLQYLKRTAFENILALNCCFITHSPFILSDIPSQNILFLDEDGNPNELLNQSRTFGGNIHDLLANNFFLNNGYMGEHANKLIDSLIKFLSSKNVRQSERVGEGLNWSEESAKRFIECVGEPLIRKSLKELYLLKFGISEIRKQFEYYKRLNEKLQ